MGFRPFVYRLAHECGLTGWVKNTPAGVLLEAQGIESGLASFRQRLESDVPPLAVITSSSETEIPACQEEDFMILASSGGENRAEISPDCDVCPDCLSELFSPTYRRYRYPFINCTNCGPRYSIITGIPYDRPLTTMADFIMCPECSAEYADPADRRYHAQPNACPACGPHLRLLDESGEIVQSSDEAALQSAIRLLHEGKIVAVKGTGGYHLAVDACNDAAVRELRRRKNRDEKPFAIMAAGLEDIQRFTLCDDLSVRLLSGPERPIVLLPKRDWDSTACNMQIAPSVAPANGYLGIMLPSTPLQYLLLRDNFPALVMTSANMSDEPIVYQDDEALAQLSGIADYYLTHDREIHTRSDDSVIRVFQGNPLFLRRSRGYVPRGIRLPAVRPNILAVGGELKGAVCLTRGGRAYLSQHIGDLKNSATLLSLEQTVDHLSRILDIQPTAVAHDLHPDYLSTAFAADIPDLPKIAVQHHHAHLASCLAENCWDGPAIGVILDGTGLGPDGTIWGGEFLLGDCKEFKRLGHFRQVPLPGGDAAAREPFRMALSWCHAAFREKVFTLPLPFLATMPPDERRLYHAMLERGINSPLTSSCGRLFDAVAALLGVRHTVSYEGQAAIELEALAEKGRSNWNYPYAVATRNGSLEVDFRLLIEALVIDLVAGEERSALARRFHNTLASAILDVCVKIRAAKGVGEVALSGGVFQNKLLTERIHELLVERDFRVFTHRLAPPNDGGLALGQAVIAGNLLSTEALT